MAQAFHHIASCGRAVTSHQSPGFEQSRSAHTHTSQIPCPRLGPQSSGRRLSPCTMSDTEDGESWERATERIYGRVMMPSNISDPFHSTNSFLSTCHTPGSGWAARKRYEQDTGEIRRPQASHGKGLCVLFISVSQGCHEVWRRAASTR